MKLQKFVAVLLYFMGEGAVTSRFDRLEVVVLRDLGASHLAIRQSAAEANHRKFKCPDFSSTESSRTSLSYIVM